MESWKSVLEIAEIRARTDKKAIQRNAAGNKRRKILGLTAQQIPDKEDIPAEAVFHALRHSFGSHLVESGIPITIAQKLLGHSMSIGVEN